MAAWAAPATPSSANVTEVAKGFGVPPRQPFPWRLVLAGKGADQFRWRGNNMEGEAMSRDSRIATEFVGSLSQDRRQYQLC